MRPRDTWLAANVCCATCGAAIVMVCCNDEMAEGLGTGADYWAYCSSKACLAHAGTGIGSGEDVPFAKPISP